MSLVTSNKRRVWITSGDGFIGKNLSIFLAKDFNLIITNRRDLDISNNQKVQKFINQVCPNIIINSSGMVGGIERNIKKPFELLTTNLQSSVGIIKTLANYYKDITYINLVSSCIYPNNFEKRIKEQDFSYNAIESTSEYYSLAKIVSYKMCNLLFRKGKKFINIIPSNLYGPYDNFNPNNSHVIAGLIEKVFNNKKKELDVLGYGKAKRDFIFIEDFCLAISKLININQFTYCNYNISGKKIISIASLSKLILELSGNNKRINLINGPIGTKFKSLNSKRIQKEFGWSEKIDLEKGLKKTINYYKNNLKDK